MPSNKVNRGLITIAATAITAVYAAGYLHTQAADATLGNTSPIPAIATAAPASARPNVVPAAQGALPTGGGTPAVAAVGRFKDGSYTGAGSSRRGDIQVSLVVQSGRVATVDITRATTQYPTRFIASLPGEVVSRQGAQVDLVSGATYSSMAFRSAVQQALQRAQV